MFLATEEEVCILRNIFCGIKSIVFKIKIATKYYCYDRFTAAHQSAQYIRRYQCGDAI